jgi:hypothetical protein
MLSIEYVGVSGGIQAITANGVGVVHFAYAYRSGSAGAVLPIEVGGSRTGAEGLHPMRSAAFFPYSHELVYVSFLSGAFPRSRRARASGFRKLICGSRWGDLFSRTRSTTRASHTRPAAGTNGVKNDESQAGAELRSPDHPRLFASGMPAGKFDKFDSTIVILPGVAGQSLTSWRLERARHRILAAIRHRIEQLKSDGDET